MRVALLQNFVAPYRVLLYERLRDRLTAFRVFVSTPMESDRNWAVDWGSLDVVVQRNLTVRRRASDPMGFTRMLQVHFPLDTLPQLWKFRPDAVISVELGFRTLQAVLFKMFRPQTRLIIWCKLSEHTERRWGFVRLTLRRFLLAKADAVLVNGESGATYITRLGISGSRVFRVNQPVDISLFAAVKRERPATARTRLLCCGALIARKGVLSFLRHIDQWLRHHPDKEIELWWLGSGPLRDELEAFICASNLSQRFLGEVPYSELPFWYCKADILAFPTLADEWGLVVNEAMAAGLPVMGSVYSQAVTELIEDGVTGWLFDPTDEASTEGALDRLYSVSAKKLAEMRAAAQERIALLTPEATADKIFDLLCKVVKPAKEALVSAVAAEPNGPASTARTTSGE
jgi:glycosyltransferase involved in cell wall biosynthesis